MSFFLSSASSASILTALCAENPQWRQASVRLRSALESVPFFKPPSQLAVDRAGAPPSRPAVERQPRAPAPPPQANTPAQRPSRNDRGEPHSATPRGHGRKPDEKK